MIQQAVYELLRAKTYQSVVYKISVVYGILETTVFFGAIRYDLVTPRYSCLMVFWRLHCPAKSLLRN